MHFSKQKIDHRIGKADLAIQNTIKNEPIRERMKEYHYDNTRMKQGEKKVERVKKAVLKQKKKLSKKLLATLELKKVLRLAKETYMGFRKLAHMALKGDTALMATLGLDKSSARTLAGWLAEARQFYSNAMASDEIMEKMAKFAVNREKLEKGQRQLEDVKKAQEYQKKRKGDAMAATEELHQALEQMDEWITDFFKVARIALKGSQLLEALGIKVPS